MQPNIRSSTHDEEKYVGDEKSITMDGFKWCKACGTFFMLCFIKILSLSLRFCAMKKPPIQKKLLVTQTSA